MARKSVNPLRIVDRITICMSAIGLLGGGLYVYLTRSDPFAKLPELPVDSYLSDGNLWSYDAYRVEGRVDNIVFRARDKEVMVASIQPAGTKVRLPVVIVPTEKMKQVQLEQELVMKVTVTGEQTLVCKEYMTKKRRGFQL